MRWTSFEVALIVGTYSKHRRTTCSRKGSVDVVDVLPITGDSSFDEILQDLLEELVAASQGLLLHIVDVELNNGNVDPNIFAGPHTAVG